MTTSLFATEAMEQMKKATETKTRYVRNWRALIPNDSRWFPGSKGDPACKVCFGLGWLRFELPISHPNFGKLFMCDCVKTAPKISEEPTEEIPEEPKDPWDERKDIQ